MLQRIPLRDWIMGAIVICGVAIASIHIASDNVMTGGLVLGGLLLGAVVRLTVADDTDGLLRAVRGEAPPEPARALNGKGRWDLDESKRDGWLRAGIIAGFAATLIMSAVLALGYLVAGSFADQDASTFSGWLHNLTHNTLTDDAFEIPVGALGVNLLVGIMWALVYAAFFERRLSGPGWRRGLLFALLPWSLSLIAFFPVVGAGILGLGLDAGPLPALGNLIAHLAFGATLGWLYLALTSAEIDTAVDPLFQAGWIDHGIALGLAAGLTVGLVVGAFAGLLVEIDGISSAELALGGAVVGILGGLIVGPLAGLEEGATTQNVPRAG